jgi:hypothetical protein
MARLQIVILRLRRGTSNKGPGEGSLVFPPNSQSSLVTLRKIFKLSQQSHVVYKSASRSYWKTTSRGMTGLKPVNIR